MSQHAPATAPWVDTDRDGVILDCSEEACPLLGYSHTDARGLSLLFMFSGHRPGAYEFGRVLAGFEVSREAILLASRRRVMTVRYAIALSPNSLPERSVFRWTLTVLSDL
jgi:PAS domain S-box-containing protein